MAYTCIWLLQVVEMSKHTKNFPLLMITVHIIIIITMFVLVRFKEGTKAESSRIGKGYGSKTQRIKIHYNIIIQRNGTVT